MPQLVVMSILVKELPLFFIPYFFYIFPALWNSEFHFDILSLQSHSFFYNAADLISIYVTFTLAQPTSC